VPPPTLLTAEDFDEALTDSLEELPAWVLEELDEVVVRAEMRPRGNGFDPRRLVIYREHVLRCARSRRELRRLVRAELVRAVVRHLQLDGKRAVELATAYY
jgi:predicted Zn-dependent protease with MMP-like domain